MNRDNGERMSYAMRATAATAVLLVWGVLTTAQNRSLSFEVTSVRPSPTNRYVPAVVNPQSFRIVSTLGDAILWAYELHKYQLSGGPPWISREYYQIEGRTQTPATKKEMRAMLQRLLADRFKLKVRGEAKEIPIYALMVGNAGPKVQIAKSPCGESGCINVAPGEFVAIAARMDAIAATLSNIVDRPVLDQTGLTGQYDFRLKFDPTFQRPFDGQGPPRVGTDAPSIFAAFQDLGLKLEPRRATVDTVVIDDAEKPAPN
jgi:uncharacterized protein (TIGR03435 family)